MMKRTSSEKVIASNVFVRDRALKENEGRVSLTMLVNVCSITGDFESVRSDPVQSR